MSGEPNGALPQEVKTLFDNLQGALAANRTKTEELEKQVKKGSEDAVTKAEWQKTSTAFDKLKDDINQLYKKMQRPQIAQLDAKTAALEVKANQEFARWTTPNGQAIDLTKAATGRAEYKAAFERMMRVGEKALTQDEQKALSVGSAPDGGFFVEPARAQEIIDKLYETSDMRSIAAVMTISTKSLEFPVDRDEADFGWVGEQAARPETNTPQVGEMEIPVHEMYAQPKATQSILDDAGINVEQWVDQKVLDQMGRGENTAFVSGNGTKQPKGFTSYATAATADASRAFGTLEHKVTGSNGAFKTASATVSPADDLLDLIYKFKKSYRSNLRWTGNRLTLGAIRKFKDQQGNYIYDARLGATGLIDVVLGYPWEEFADMADFTTTGALAIALGDFKRGYQIVDRQGVRQLRDPFSSKPYVLFYTTKRVGGAVKDSDAIKFLKFST